MSKKTLTYIAVTMCMALIGLLSVQFYWTKRIYLLNQEFFETSVNDAMQDVVTELSRDLLSERIARFRNKSGLYGKLDSVNYQIMQMRRRYPEVVGEYSGIVMDASGQYALTPIPVRKVEWQETVNGVSVRSTYMQTDAEKVPVQSLSSAQKKQIAEEYAGLKKFRNDLIYAAMSMDEILLESGRETSVYELESGISPFVIDTLISHCLEEKHIRTLFEWGIYSSFNGKLIIQKTGNYGVQLLKSKFGYRLYPNRQTDYPVFLFLYFPDRLSFLLSQIWYLLLSSFFLFALLMYTFTYTLVSIWKQRKLTEMKSDFINHVTHEIKTPVSTISLICESFDDPDVHYDREGIENVMKIIRHENQRLQSLSRQIIQISKMESGDIFLNKTVFSLHKAIEEAANNTGFQVMHKNGRIVTRLEASDDRIEGDRTHIVHIISNLIDNANKYCQEKPLIEITTRNVDGGIQVDVKDNGIGIAKSNFGKIFDKLYRVPTGNKHDVKGFGLGLSYVASIMRLHKGKVWLESELRQGSVFHLFFPQNDVPDVREEETVREQGK